MGRCFLWKEKQCTMSAVHAPSPKSSHYRLMASAKLLDIRVALIYVTFFAFSFTSLAIVDHDEGFVCFSVLAFIFP